MCRVLAAGKGLTPDLGGKATTDEFCGAVSDGLRA
jgi:hypothetical protein